MSVGNGRTWSVQLPGYVGSHYQAALVFPTTHGEAGLERSHRGRPVTLTDLVDSPIRRSVSCVAPYRRCSRRARMTNGKPSARSPACPDPSPATIFSGRGPTLEARTKAHFRHPRPLGSSSASRHATQLGMRHINATCLTQFQAGCAGAAVKPRRSGAMRPTQPQSLTARPSLHHLRFLRSSRVRHLPCADQDGKADLVEADFVCPSSSGTERRPQTTEQWPDRLPPNTSLGIDCDPRLRAIVA